MCPRANWQPAPPTATWAHLTTHPVFSLSSSASSLATLTPSPHVSSLTIATGCLPWLAGRLVALHCWSACAPPGDLEGVAHSTARRVSMPTYAELLLWRCALLLPITFMGRSSSRAGQHSTQANQSLGLRDPVRQQAAHSLVHAMARGKQGKQVAFEQGIAGDDSPSTSGGGSLYRG